jgi:hypothetical protein
VIYGTVIKGNLPGVYDNPEVFLQTDILLDEAKRTRKPVTLFDGNTYRLVRRKAQKDQDYVCGNTKWRIWELEPVNSQEE